MADETRDKGQPIDQVVWMGSDIARTRQSETAKPVATPEPEPTAPPAPAPPPQPAVAPPPPRPKADPPPATAEPIPTIADGVAPKHQSRALAQTVISTFTDRLKEEAQKRGGYLTVGDIDQLSREFDRKREALEAVFQQSFEQYVSIRERAAFDHARQFPFDRVIVNTFATLFQSDRIAEDGPRAVTRRVLPGFFLALDKMIGPDAMEQFQARCRVIVHRLSKGVESELDWVELYADPEAQRVCFDALVTFAPYFEDIKKRCEWFLPLVNNNLTADDDWELQEGGFHNLVGEMFSDLRDELADAEARKNLEAHYGGVACFELDRVFEKMDKG